MKKWLQTFLIGLCIFGFQQFNVALADELAEDYLTIANNYFCAQNYDKALEYLDDVLKIEPENTEAQNLKIKILPLCGKNETIAEAQAPVKVLASQPQSENFVILNVPQADVEKMSYDSDYYNKKGQEFYDKKDYDSAIEYFYKSIKLNSKNQQAYNNLAMAYWFKNNLGLAVKYFKKAYSINKNYTQPLVNLALLYKQLGDDEKQLNALQTAIKHNPNDYCAYFVLGEYYKNRSDYKNAVANYKEVVKINPKYSQVYLSLALCFFETEEFNYSLMAFNQYLEYNPNSDFAYYMMARTSLVLCRYNEAKDYIIKAIGINNKPEYQFELAKIDYYLGDYQLALDIFQTLLQSANNAEYFNYAGLCNYKLQNFDAAIANFNKAVETDGLRPIYYYNLGQCYKSLGDKKNYTKCVNTATKITPINFQDFIDLSYIYYDNGNPGYAINTLNAAITRYPTVKALYLSKLKICEALGDNLHYNEVKDLINERFNTK